jgi:membrane-associated phospholipid phosphatase
MRPVGLLRIAAVSAVLSALAILFVDRPLAVFLHARGGFLTPLFESGTVWIERLFGWQISKYLLGLVLAAAGLTMLIMRRRNQLAAALLVIGVSNLLGRLTAGTLKNVFERPRPEEWIVQGIAFFAADGNSFPSTHTAHFWSLFFALALFSKPAYWPWAAVVPVFISVARVAVNDHFAGDVFAGIAIAALVTWCTQKLLLPRLAALKTRTESAV